MSSRVSPPKTEIAQGNLYSSIDLSFGFAVVILNIIEIIIIGRLKRKKRIYEILLLSLSISDLLFGLSNVIISILLLSGSKKYQPLEITYVTYFYSIATSILHLSWITVDRLLAVYSPVKHNSYVTRKRTKYIIIITWICTVIITSSIFAYDELTKCAKSNTTTEALNNHQHHFRHASSIIILTTDVVFLFSYSYIVYLLHKQANAVKRSSGSYTRHKQMKTFILCVIVAVVFVFFTLPYCLMFLATGNIPFWASMLLVCNSGMNSIVYCFRGKYEHYLDKRRQQKELQDKSYINMLSSPIATPLYARKEIISPAVISQDTVYV